MRIYSLITTLLMCASLGACGEKKNTAVEPVPVTSVAQQDREIAERLAAQKANLEAKSVQEGEAAERQRFVKLVQDPADRWVNAYAQLAGKKAAELDPIIAEFRASRAALATVPTSTCTLPKRDAILAAMDKVLAVMNEFKAVGGNVGPEFATRPGEAAAPLFTHYDALAQCG